MEVKAKDQVVMRDDGDKLHIAMFPWLAFGHMIPWLELANHIAQRGHTVSFISTPTNIARLPPHLARFITFVHFPLPQLENLPPNAESTSDLPSDKVVYLKLAFDALREPLTNFLKTHKPDWILFDFNAYWIPPIARDLGISTSFFSIVIASSLCNIIPPTFINVHDDRVKPEDFTLVPKWIPFETTVSFRLYEILKIFQTVVVGDEINVSDQYRAQTVIKECDAVFVRGCVEFDGEWQLLLEQLHGKPVIPVGLLPSTDYDTTGVETDTWTWIKEWLDKQKKGSVVYVAFGSEAKPSQDEVTEIALGLELAGLPFFWVLITRRGEADTDIIEWPDGFEERVRGRGVVYTSWAPQGKILSHDSVGGMFTHAGYSSVVEAIGRKKPLILLAFFVDQGLIARLLEEKKMAYLIPRNDDDGFFTRNSVAESLKLVMQQDEGKIYRDKAKEMSSLFSDGKRQNRYIDKFLEFIKK